jgi:hypothetical protein
VLIVVVAAFGPARSVLGRPYARLRDDVAR